MNNFSLLGQVDTIHKFNSHETSNIRYNLKMICERADVTVQQVTEAITHVLANLINTIEQNKPITLLHINSVADLLAGVDALSTALPAATDKTRVANTVRILSNVAVGKDGELNQSAVPIINYGAKATKLRQEYRQMLNAYAKDVESAQSTNHSDLLKQIRLLRQNIDRAMFQVKGK